MELTDRERAIRERVEAATNGPWELRERAHEATPFSQRRVYRMEIISPQYLYGRRTHSRDIAQMVDYCEWSDHPANAAFIAHSREDIPWLLDQLAAARERNEALERERDAERTGRERIEQMLNACHSRPVASPPNELRPNSQHCKRCGAADKMNFHVADEEWTAITSPEWTVTGLCDTVLCLACFDDLAKAKGLTYTLKSFIFAGDVLSTDFIEERNAAVKRAERAEAALTPFAVVLDRYKITVLDRIADGVQLDATSCIIEPIDTRHFLAARAALAAGEATTA